MTRDTYVYGTILCCCKLTGYTAHPITVQLSPKDFESSLALSYDSMVWVSPKEPSTMLK